MSQPVGHTTLIYVSAGSEKPAPSPTASPPTLACHACAAPKYVPLTLASTATALPAPALTQCTVVIHLARCPVPPTATAVTPPAMLLRVTSTALRRSTFADRPVLPAHIATKQLVESALPAPQENGRRALTLSAISSANRALLEDGRQSLV